MDMDVLFTPIAAYITFRYMYHKIIRIILTVSFYLSVTIHIYILKYNVSMVEMPIKCTIFN